MSVVLVLGLVGSVSAVINPGRGAFIILITDSAESDLAALEPLLKGFYGDGVSIEAVDEKYRDLDAEKIANLKSANLIIVSDNSDDDEYCNGPNEIEFWNGLETPIFLTANDHGSSESDPNYMWRWFDADGENEEWAMGENLYLDVNDVNDPIWDGVTTDDNRVWIMYWDFEKTPELPDCNSAGYGTLLATGDAGAAEPNLMLARWAPGTQFWDDPCNPQTAGGPRIFFAMESFDPQLSDLTPAGEKLMENMITELLWYTFDPNIAYGPYPKPGEPMAPVDAKLHWSPGENVGSGGGINGHILYFSTNWEDVNERNIALCGEVILKDPNEWDPFGSAYLEYGQTYYWCVDEFNSVHPDGQYPATLWRGPVWSFTAAPPCSSCCGDFECFATTDELRYCWSNTESTTLTLETGETAIAHESAQAMCMNTYYEVGAATTLTATPPASWPESSKAMGVWFHGDAANVLAGAQLFLTIEDGTGDSNTVYYDGDMNDLTEENWHQWGIDLADFRDAVPAVDLLDVKKLTLGFGNEGEDSSTIYFDDIELFEWMCIAPPEGDFTGPGDFNDCVVDIWDLRAFTDVWLEHEYVIYAEPVTDDACAHWDFEEGTGSEVADITGNGNTGRFLVDCNYPDGYDYDGANKPEWVAGKVGTWALHFDGNDFVRIEGTEGATIECGNEPFTMCIWLNYDEYDEDNNPGTMPVFYKGGDKNGTWPTAYDQSPWDASEKRYAMHFGPGGTEGDSDLWIALDDDGSGSTGGKTRIHGYRQMDPNVWYHLAIQRDWDAHKLRVYLNAELIADEGDESYQASIASPGEPLFIGMKPTNDPPRWAADRFIGKLDDMRIYKSVLSEGQILSIMGLSERFVPIHHTEFNPVEDWIINFEDVAPIVDNWGANTRFP